jgi:hypothetical protein
MDMDGYPVSSTYWRDNNGILLFKRCYIGFLASLNFR